MIRLRPSGVDEILIKRVQDWYEPGLGVFIQSLTASFSPAMLFTGTTQGVWYDPSDITTLYRDAAGTQPVTAVEQPVGLMLDKSKGLVLGPELVTNGDFAGVANGTDVTTLPGWAAYGTPASRDVQGERLRIQATAGSQGARLTLSTIIGKRYILKAIVAGDLGLAGVYSDYAGDVSTLSGSVNVQFVATATSSVIFFRAANNSAGTTYYDNISVRELPGNHAFNGSGNSANFPVLSARYNLLTKTEDFSSADWSKYNITATSDTLTLTSTTGAAYKHVAIPANVQHRVYCKVKAGTNQFAYINVQYGNGGEYATQVFDVQNGIVGQSAVMGAGMVLASPSIVQDGDWWVCSMVVTVSATTASASTVAIGFANALTGNSLDTYGNPLGCVSGRTLMVKQADLRVTNDALNQPEYQRVNTATDYDTVGFKPYLRFNGTNQWLQTNSIDFTYGDKMFVSAGVRKLSDSAPQGIVELSLNADTNNGSFWVRRDYQYLVRSGGGTNAVFTDSVSAPRSDVIALIADLAAPLTRTRLNGVDGNTNANPSGGGNFGNYPLYIGARAGSSLWFNGRLYQMVVAGKQATAAEITSTETYLNQKTGAY